MATQPVSGGGKIIAETTCSGGMASRTWTVPNSIPDDRDVDYSRLSQIHLPGRESGDLMINGNNLSAQVG
jgi:hypothetical protein